MRTISNKALPITRMALVIAFLLSPASVWAALEAPEVTKVEPPNWWSGHSINPVRVMIRGRNLVGARVEASGSGIKTGLTRVNGTGTYVFVDVLIDVNAAPGRRGLRITTPGGATEASFEIATPLSRV